jgi:hypothetical protein
VHCACCDLTLEPEPHFDAVTDNDGLADVHRGRGWCIITLTKPKLKLLA